MIALEDIGKDMYVGCVTGRRLLLSHRTAEHDRCESYSWNTGGNHRPFGTTQASPPILSTSPKGEVISVTLL